MSALRVCRRSACAASLSIFLCTGSGCGEDSPADPGGSGSVVIGIDAAHHNFHTSDGRYAPFAALLVDNGFEVRSSAAPWTAAALAGLDVLVVANALHESNIEVWALPTPSAFTPAEIDAVVAWVNAGGALLLVADHMPFPGAAATLAARFGVEMSNGFALDTTQLALPKPCLAPGEAHVFSRAAGTLAAHPITDGRSAAERVDSVATFTGQAFRAPAGQPLLTFAAGAVSLLPEEAWSFGANTPRVDAAGWLQGVALGAGSGRVVVLGEAAMLTVQTCDGNVPMGMNAPAAAHNARFAIGVMRWLSN